jgi:hypothetical protein
MGGSDDPKTEPVPNPDELHRGERAQPVAGVEHHLAGTDASVLQYSVSDRYEKFKRLSLPLAVVGVAR